MYVVLTKRQGSETLELVWAGPSQEGADARAAELRAEEPWDEFNVAEVDE